MARTYEEMLSDSIEKGVKHFLTKELRPLVKENQMLKEEVASLKATLTEAIEKLAFKDEFTSIDNEKLITKVKAGEILGINKRAIDGLIDQGKLLIVDVPDGRDKVLHSSVIKYIQNLQIKNLRSKAI